MYLYLSWSSLSFGLKRPLKDLVVNVLFLLDAFKNICLEMCRWPSYACYSVWYLECHNVDNAVFREGALNEVPSACLP